MVYERKKQSMAYERETMVFALKEAQWKRERRRLREEVKRLKKRLEEKEERIRGMEDGLVGEKGENGFQLLGTRLLVEHIWEERARRDEAVEKWKRLYLAIKAELDDLIQRTDQGKNSTGRSKSWAYTNRWYYVRNLAHILWLRWGNGRGSSVATLLPGWKVSHCPLSFPHIVKGFILSINMVLEKRPFIYSPISFFVIGCPPHGAEGKDRERLNWKAEEEDSIEDLHRELKAKEETIEVLKARLASMEKEEVQREREVDILRQSLRIISNKKETKHSTKHFSRSLHL
ncbi:hypothetical protein CK203_026083 [Vitis vinifera]|uniref:Uncharacterized protein n=1 Tax=Vitis vinifera TaxID=29760 RepID=A0A438IJK1_VITVI|nr:hypothetical protein CK203_026083 [Vitis vinifera]